MNPIKVKLKEKLPLDEELLKHKNFNAVISEYRAAKSGYKQVGSIWGAIIGLGVFVGIIAFQLNSMEQTQDLPIQKASKEKKISPQLEEESYAVNESETPQILEVTQEQTKEKSVQKTELKKEIVQPTSGTENTDSALGTPEKIEEKNSANKVIRIRYQGQN